ncbi:piercer of microtubule wall 1 protein-like isoform X1 [Lineus longissimus]|uniref:piercer of microtubule wall 1 protein-like isoform X1 n=1 Tax=Lineus longissimus TaxID=88925 RepID=UPI00315C77E2
MADHTPCALRENDSAPAELGSGGVPKGPVGPTPINNPGNPVFTCHEEFPTPEPRESGPDDWFQGYGNKPQNPMYMTSSSSIGKLSPTVHTMPTSFHCKSQKFSEHLGKCGPFRNHSMNTALDKSIV